MKHEVLVSRGLMASGSPSSVKCVTAVIVLFFLTVCAGCSDKPDLDFGSVKGKVVFDGQPLPNATVNFIPANGRPSYAKTNANGEYEMKYRGQDWGALIGTHQVKITTADQIEDMESGEVNAVPELLPAKYHAATTLTAQVKEGANEIDFTLEK